VERPGLVRVYHERHGVAHRLADARDALLVLGGVGLADLELESAEATALHGFAREGDELLERPVEPAYVRVVSGHAVLSASEEDVERQARALRGEVPQRRVHRGERDRAQAPGRERVDLRREEAVELPD